MRGSRTRSVSAVRTVTGSDGDSVMRMPASAPSGGMTSVVASSADGDARTLLPQATVVTSIATATVFDASLCTPHREIKRLPIYPHVTCEVDEERTAHRRE